MQQSEDLLLGRLAVQQGVCTQEQIDECLKMQSFLGSTAPLGDLLVFKGYLSGPQLKALLLRQHKRLMSCPACKLSYTVLTLSGGRTAPRCPKCKGSLVERGPETTARSDAEFSTSRVGVVRPPDGPKVRRICIICDEPFEGAADSSGRVQCPACRSTFVDHTAV